MKRASEGGPAPPERAGGAEARGPIPRYDDPHAAALDLTARTGRPVRFQTVGRSMWPLLWPGDVLLCEPAGAVPPTGAIVLVRREGVLVAHRVIGRLPD